MLPSPTITISALPSSHTPAHPHSNHINHPPPPPTMTSHIGLTWTTSSSSSSSSHQWCCTTSTHDIRIYSLTNNNSTPQLVKIWTVMKPMTIPAIVNEHDDVGWVCVLARDNNTIQSFNVDVQQIPDDVTTVMLAGPSPIVAILPACDGTVVVILRDGTLQLRDCMNLTLLHQHDNVPNQQVVHAQVVRREATCTRIACLVRRGNDVILSVLCVQHRRFEWMAQAIPELGKATFLVTTHDLGHDLIGLSCVMETSPPVLQNWTFDVRLPTTTSPARLTLHSSTAFALPSAPRLIRSSAGCSFLVFDDDLILAYGCSVIDNGDVSFSHRVVTTTDKDGTKLQDCSPSPDGHFVLVVMAPSPGTNHNVLVTVPSPLLSQYPISTLERALKISIQGGDETVATTVKIPPGGFDTDESWTNIVKEEAQLVQATEGAKKQTSLKRVKTDGLQGRAGEIIVLRKAAKEGWQDVVKMHADTALREVTGYLTHCVSDASLLEETGALEKLAGVNAHEIMSAFKAMVQTCEQGEDVIGKMDELLTNEPTFECETLSQRGLVRFVYRVLPLLTEGCVATDLKLACQSQLDVQDALVLVAALLRIATTLPSENKIGHQAMMLMAIVLDAQSHALLSCKDAEMIVLVEEIIGACAKFVSENVFVCETLKGLRAMLVENVMVSSSSLSSSSNGYKGVSNKKQRRVPSSSSGRNVIAFQTDMIRL